MPLVGVEGAGFVLPQAANPAEGSRHRVYLKGMLLSDATAGLLPDWAFFVRCVINADGLRPTASREALYEDETLALVREKLGERIRDWLARLAAEDPQRLAAFLGVHALGVKALARHDHELLRMMLDHLPFETTDGRVTLAEFARSHPVMYLAPTVEEFRQVAPIASAQGIGVVNGGYTYDDELLTLLPQVLPGVTVDALDAGVVSAALDPVAPEDELAQARLLAVARAASRPARLRRHAARVPAGDRARAVPGQPGGPGRADAGRGRGVGRRPVGGDPGGAQVDRRAGAARPQPPQPGACAGWPGSATRRCSGSRSSRCTGRRC